MAEQDPSAKTQEFITIPDWSETDPQTEVRHELGGGALKSAQLTAEPAMEVTYHPSASVDTPAPDRDPYVPDDIDRIRYNPKKVQVVHGN